MPLYEYRCGGCGKKVTLLVRSTEGSRGLCCPNCSSADLKRLFSTFRVTKTDHDIYEDILGDNRLVRGMESNDPKALVEWNKRMSRGDESVAPEYEDMMGKMSAGEWPEEMTGGRRRPASEEAEEE